jgi:hypothetical protein
MGTPAPGRIASLDQFRGYTVVGMFFVNFVGSFTVIPAVFKHHNTYCSYADTIMPQFFFAVGFAYRLTLLRRLEKDGPRAAYVKAVRRNLGLMLLGAILYSVDDGLRNWADIQTSLPHLITVALRRDFFQTLVHIAVTALWILPVIASGPVTRISFACFSAFLHVALSQRFYYEAVNSQPRGIDGGPLGFLTWTIPMIAGSLAYDAIRRAGWFSRAGSPSPATEGTLPASEGAEASGWPRLRLLGCAVRLLAWGGVLMALGYGLSCLNLFVPPNSPPTGGPASWLVEPPFVPPSRPVNLWTMSQRAGSVSYLTFGAGFSLAVYALFVVASDLGPLRLGVFRTFGSNALAAYVIHEMVARAVKPFVPNDAPLWYVLAAFALFFAICYVFVRYLEKNGLFLRL